MLVPSVGGPVEKPVTINGALDKSQLRFRKQNGAAQRGKGKMRVDGSQQLCNARRTTNRDGDAKNLAACRLSRLISRARLARLATG